MQINNNLYLLFIVNLLLYLFQAQFEMQSKEGAERIIASAHSTLHFEEMDIPDRPHTLEEYARNYFVPPAARTIGRSGIRREKNVVWSFQKVRIFYKIAFACLVNSPLQH